MTLQIDFQLIDISVEVLNENNFVALLKDISLHISQGEWISIVGKNGSGKSTLAQLIAGVREATSGIIQRGFCGNELIPYVMQQEVQWFGETPEEDMIFLLESRGEDVRLIPGIIQTALQNVGIESLRDQPFAEMSGGQKQLAAIAGCLAAKTPIIVFDEATSMLDSSSRQQVLEAAKAVNQQGTAVVWLTHHIEDLSYGERVIALESGKICYDDSTISFFYQCSTFDSDNTISLKTPCEALGFTLPYPIQVAHQLKLKGIQLFMKPLTSEQLVEAVGCLV